VKWVTKNQPLGPSLGQNSTRFCRGTIADIFQMLLQSVRAEDQFLFSVCSSAHAQLSPPTGSGIHLLPLHPFPIAAPLREPSVTYYVHTHICRKPSTAQLYSGWPHNACSLSAVPAPMSWVPWVGCLAVVCHLTSMGPCSAGHSQRLQRCAHMRFRRRSTRASRRMMNTPKLMLPDACPLADVLGQPQHGVWPPWLFTQSPTLVSGRTGRLSTSKSAAAAAATLQGSGFPFRVGARQRKNPDCPHVQPPITPEADAQAGRTGAGGSWWLDHCSAAGFPPSPRCCRRLLLPSTSCTSCPQGPPSQRLCEEGRFRKKVHGPFERLQACSSLSLQPSLASALPGCRAASGSVPLPPSCA
jgi:hypothetical protein